MPGAEMCGLQGAWPALSLQLNGKMRRFSATGPPAGLELAMSIMTAIDNAPVRRGTVLLVFPVTSPSA